MNFYNIIQFMKKIHLGFPEAGMGHRLEGQHGKETLKLPKKGQWGVAPYCSLSCPSAPRAAREDQ